MTAEYLWDDTHITIPLTGYFDGRHGNDVFGDLKPEPDGDQWDGSVAVCVDPTRDPLCETAFLQGPSIIHVRVCQTVNLHAGPCRPLLDSLYPSPAAARGRQRE